MANCEALRNAIVAAKARRNDAMRANALAENEGRPPLHSVADMDAMRLAVDVATLEACDAGCDVDDLVGPNVGDLS